MRKIETITGLKGTVNVYRHAETGEYIARPVGNVAGDYFSDDRQDVLATARVMAGPEMSLGTKIAMVMSITFCSEEEALSVLDSENFVIDDAVASIIADRRATFVKARG